MTSNTTNASIQSLNKNWDFVTKLRFFLVVHNNLFFLYVIFHAEVVVFKQSVNVIEELVEHE